MYYYCHWSHFAQILQIRTVQMKHKIVTWWRVQCSNIINKKFNEQKFNRHWKTILVSKKGLIVYCVFTNSDQRIVFLSKNLKKHQYNVFKKFLQRSCPSIYKIFFVFHFSQLNPEDSFDDLTINLKEFFETGIIQCIKLQMNYYSCCKESWKSFFGVFSDLRHRNFFNKLQFLIIIIIIMITFRILCYYIINTIESCVWLQ